MEDWEGVPGRIAPTDSWEVASMIPCSPVPRAWRPAAAALTLVQVLLIALVLAVVAAIAIPSYLRARQLGAETSVLSDLKHLSSTQRVWREADLDGNGVQDYWTYDVAGLWGLPGQDGTPVAQISPAMARADAAGSGRYPGLGPPGPHGGFLFTMMATQAADDGGGTYQANRGKVSRGGVNYAWAAHPSKFAICAYPSSYGEGDARQHIVDERGIIWARDTGSASPTLVFPSKDPTSASPPWVPLE